PETVPVGIVARMFGKNVLWDVEEDSGAAIEHSDWIPHDFRKPITTIYRVFERLAASLFSGISIAEDGYIPRFTNAKRVEVIHNYPPKPAPKAQDPSRGKIAEKRWKQTGPRLLYVGAVTEHRGILETVRAVELLEDDLPDVCLDVVGAIPREEYRSRLMAARSKLKKPDRITFHGQVPFDSLGDYFERAQIGLLPLWPQPNHLVSLQTKLFEYALAGLPTVVGDVPLWRTIVDTSKSGVVAEPRNSSDWAEAIHKLWKWGPQKLVTAGRRAHNLVVKNNWFWEPERARLAALCRDIIEGIPVE
ncbi:MAG: glycosyltransferase, partial [bacterium]